MFYELIEQIRCPNGVCDSAIRPELAVSSVDPGSGVRTVKAFCEHCRTLWLARFVLSGGIWIIRDAPRPIRDSRLINSFQRRHAAALGQTQLAQGDLS